MFLLHLVNFGLMYWLCLCACLLAYLLITFYLYIEVIIPVLLDFVFVFLFFAKKSYMLNTRQLLFLFVYSVVSWLTTNMHLLLFSPEFIFYFFLMLFKENDYYNVTMTLCFDDLK